MFKRISTTALAVAFGVLGAVGAYADCTPVGTNLSDNISCTLDLTTPFDSLAGNDFIEVVTGATLSADISTSSGNDVFDLNGGTGNGNIFLGSGNDTFIYNTDSSTLNGTVDAGTGIDNITLVGAGSIPINGANFESFNALSVNTGANNIAQILGDLAGIGDIALVDGAGISLGAGTSITANISVSGTDPDGSQVYINGGTLTGNIDFAGVLNGNGTQAISVTNGGVLTGDALFGIGNDVYELSGSSTHKGNLDMGDGLNVATLESQSMLDGNFTAGGENDVLALNNADITGNVDLGDGDNILQMANSAGIFGNVTLGSGNDMVNVNSGSSITGNLDLGEGDNTLGMVKFGLVNGTVTAGVGSDTLTLDDNSGINGAVNLGDGNNSVTLTNNSFLNDGLQAGVGNDQLAVLSGSQITGNINLGEGSNSATVDMGSLLGDLLLGDGDDVLTLKDASVATVFTAGGADVLNIDNDSSFTAIYGGNGADIDVVNATEAGTLNAEGIDQFEQLTIGHGAETILVGPSMIFPSVTLLNNSQFGLAQGSFITGNIEADDTNTDGMAVGISGTMVGNIDFTTSGNNGAGTQTVSLYRGAVFNGDIKTGEGDDMLKIYPQVDRRKTVDLGENADDNDIVRIIGDAAFAADLASTDDAVRTAAEREMIYSINGAQITGAEALSVENYAQTTLVGASEFENSVNIGANGTIKAAGAQVNTKNFTNGGTLDLTNDGLGVANDLRLSADFNQTPTGHTIFGLGTIGGQNDQIVASGTASLDGTFSLVDPSLTIYQLNDRFDLIAADQGVIGQFDTAAYPEGYVWQQHYDPNLFWVEITGYNALHALTQDCNTITDFNTREACKGLDQTNPTGGAAALSAIVSNLSGDDLTNAFKELSPQPYAGNTIAAVGAMDGFTSTLRQRMGDMRAVPLQREYRGLNFWVRGNASHQEIDAATDEIGYAITHAGTTVGLDAAVADHLNLGFAAHHSQGDVDFVGRSGGQTDLDTRQMAAYATYQKDAFYVDGIATVADLDYETTRPINFSGFNETATGDYNGDSVSAQLETGVQLEVAKDTFLEPYVMANYTNINNETFSETGADAANLTIQGDPIDRIAARAGVRARKTMDFGFATLSPQLHAAYQREFSDDYAVSAVNAQYAADPVLSSHQGRSTLSKDRAIVGVGLEGSVGKGMTAFANYDADLADDSITHEINIGARWQNTVE